MRLDWWWREFKTSLNHQDQGYATRLGPDGRIVFQEYMYALSAKAGSALHQQPDRSKTVDRNKVPEPEKSAKDEESKILPIRSS